MTFIDTSDFSLSPYLMPERFITYSIIGYNKSVSKFDIFFCRTDASLSSPQPVSIFLCASGLYSPSSVLSYCVKTKFHISKNLSQSQPTPQVGLPQPRSSPKSIYISESGPHGPGPISQKLSSIFTIWSLGKPGCLSHMSRASSSFGYIDTHNLSLGSSHHSVKNSHAQGIASALK